MLYRIKHITEYLYGDRVSHCYNMGHLIPRNSQRQKCLNTQIQVEPLTAFTSTREDYFGNRAYHFEIQRPHKKLSITAISEVDTQLQSFVQNYDHHREHGIRCGEALHKMQMSQDLETILAKEFLMDSPMIRANQALRDYAAPSFSDDKPLIQAIMDLTQRIFQEFTYCPEATTIATPLSEVLANKRGVCQDFAHLQIGCLRAMGFAAKYVSGYLETLPAPGEEKLIGADASHAWLSVYIPTEGWFEFDPTNDKMANEQHIITAWGRDYLDVTPLSGVIYGGGEKPILTVSVDVARL